MKQYTILKTGYKSYSRRLRNKYIATLSVVKTIKADHIYGGIDAKNTLIDLLEDDIKWITKALKNVHRRSAYKYPNHKAFRNVLKRNATK